MNITAQCCGLVILCIVKFFYHRKVKFRLRSSKAFICLWMGTFLSLCMDIGSLVAIANRNILPLWFVNLVCKGYLYSLSLLCMASLIYVFVDMLGKDRRDRRMLYTFIGLMCAAGIVVLLFPISISVSLTGAAYTFGIPVYGTYAVVALLLLVNVIILIKDKALIGPKKRSAVALWMLLWITAATIQFFFNEILIVGFAASLGVLIIYIRLENPDMGMDLETNTYNSTTFLRYLQEKQIQNQDVSLICLSLDIGLFGASSRRKNKIMLQQIVNFLQEQRGVTLFRISPNEFILSFDEQETAKWALMDIEDRFERPWGQNKLAVVQMDWMYLQRTEIVMQAEDIMSIFQYTRQNRQSLGTSDGVIIDNDIIRALYKEREMEAEIISAINDDRVEVFYQPIFSVEKQRFTTAEALVRIRDVNGELIPPGAFITVAERKGLIIKLGEIVFRKVCEFLQDGEVLSLGVDAIEVNLSVLQCAYEPLADDFLRIMKETGVDPTRIVLEITESASTKDKKVLLANMEKLRARGVTFALDDFGTGRSNLNYIVEMPVDIVKFDYFMIHAFFAGGTATYVMNAAMQMIKGMHLKIVAEGIEEEMQHKAMEAIEIDYVQGFYFSKPIDQEHFIHFLKERN